MSKKRLKSVEKIKKNICKNLCIRDNKAFLIYMKSINGCLINIIDTYSQYWDYLLNKHGMHGTGKVRRTKSHIALLRIHQALWELTCEWNHIKNLLELDIDCDPLK